MSRKRNQPRGKSLEVLQRRDKVAGLYLEGKTQWDMAKILGVSQTTICKDLEALHKAWKESPLPKIDEARNKELNRIDKLEATYWEAWESSKKPLEVTSSEKMDSETGGGRKKSSIKREHRDGNPAFLQGIRECIAMRTKMLGVDKPAELPGLVTESVDDVRPKIFPGEMIG